MPQQAYAFPLWVSDNFFELGDDALLGIQVMTHVNQCGLGLSAKNLFKHQANAELAHWRAPSQALAARLPVDTPEANRVPQAVETTTRLSVVNTLTRLQDMPRRHPSDVPQARVSQQDVDALPGRIGEAQHKEDLAK